MFNSSNTYKNGSARNEAAVSSGPSTSSAIVDDVWSRNDAALAAQQEQILRMKKLREKKLRAAMSKEAQIQRAKERFSQMHKSNKRELRVPDRFREAPTPPPLPTCWNQVAREDHVPPTPAEPEPVEAEPQPIKPAPTKVDKSTQAPENKDEKLEYAPCLRMHYNCNAFCKFISQDLKMMVPFFLLRKTPSNYTKEAKEQERMRLIDRLCNPFGKKHTLPIVSSCGTSVHPTEQKEEVQENQESEASEESQPIEVTEYMREFPALSAGTSRGRGSKYFRS